VIAPEIDFVALVAFNRPSMWSQCGDAIAALVRDFSPRPE
jgi:hypothetical protein